MQPLGENTVNTPAFLGKLWKMVNDPSTDHLISWSPTGNSFIIQNQAQFWYELLPLYYKHNNMSSFVRQLNMYGFHKMSTVENGTMDADKDEIQFMHPYFVKDQPELLRNIKRKAATSKSNENCGKHDELTKILTDVKSLRGRQVSVDTQLHAMKHENALLWREVAILRQKHMKQQKIVNKLIQFLVTLVHPSRMTVGVKRGGQLMLHGIPNKKSKTTNNKNVNPEGPTIHELDNELDLSPNLYEEDVPLIDSPAASVSSQQTDLNSPLQTQLLVEGHGDPSSSDTWDQPEFVTINNANSSDELNLAEADLNEESLINTLENGSPTSNSGSINDKVFLNPSAQNTLLSNLMKNNYPITTSVKNGKSRNNQNIEKSVTKPNMAVATRDIMKSMASTSDSYSSDLNNHVEATQSELEQLKDILNGYNSFDTNALLGEFNKIPQNCKDVNLFSEDSPVYDLHMTEDKDDNVTDAADPLVSGSELTPYGGNFDFTELFDDSIDNVATSGNSTSVVETNPSESINTPQILKEEPVFPAI